MTTDDSTLPSPPKAFFSYSWDSSEHRQWVADLASRLRADGVELSLDDWHLRPGDQLPEFMEKAVRESDFVLIVCTERYKEKSDSRLGGVGYEGHIITGELLTAGNQRKFIPLLREDEWQCAAPSWLTGKYYLDFRGDPYPEASYDQLIDTLHGLLPDAPAVRVVGGHSKRALAPEAITRQTKYTDFINTAIKVFYTANQKFVLFRSGSRLAQNRISEVQNQLDTYAAKVKEMVLEFHVLSSEGVSKAAGEVVGWVLAAEVASVAPQLEPKFKEANQRFLRESITRFREAVRKELGLNI